MSQFMKRAFLRLRATRFALPIAVILVALSAGSAFALFSSTLSLGGINVTIGSSVLQAQLPDGTWVSDKWSSGYDMTGLYPGLSTSANITLKNASTAPIDLKVSARLVSAGGDWDALKDVIEVRVRDAANSHSSTGFKTLSAWNADGGITIPGGDLAHDTSKTYTIDVQIDKKYGNELANEKLSNLQIELTGIQD